MTNTCRAAHGPEIQHFSFPVCSFHLCVFKTIPVFQEPTLLFSFRRLLPWKQGYFSLWPPSLWPVVSLWVTWTLHGDRPRLASEVAGFADVQSSLDVGQGWVHVCLLPQHRLLNVCVLEVLWDYYTCVRCLGALLSADRLPLDTCTKHNSHQVLTGASGANYRFLAIALFSPVWPPPPTFPEIVMSQDPSPPDVLTETSMKLSGVRVQRGTVAGENWGGWLGFRFGANSRKQEVQRITKMKSVKNQKETSKCESASKKMLLLQGFRQFQIQKCCTECK